jgi:hypothetical protein
MEGSSNGPLMSDGPSLLLGLVGTAHVPRTPQKQWPADVKWPVTFVCGSINDPLMSDSSSLL